MSTIRTLGAAVIASVIAAPAFAAMPSAPPAGPPPAPDQNAIAAERAGMNTSGVVLLSSPTPGDQAHLLKAGDPTVTSNQPIADTPANRARYGQPMSNGGRRTAPIGN